MPVIKRYANRKLYDTEAKRYVTLEDLAEFVRNGEEVQVVDHVTGEDLTSTTLLQVIFDEQKKIAGLFPQVALTRLIRAGGTTVNSLRSRLGWLDPFQLVDDEIARRIQSLVEKGTLSVEEGIRLVDLLTRRSTRADVIHIPVQGEDEDGAEAAQDVATPVEEPADPAEVEALLRQVEALEQQLAQLKK
jgi:polyhydroxyalkanoate synthesis repressor PhaR